jgi:hypothetical protein
VSKLILHAIMNNLFSVIVQAQLKLSSRNPLARLCSVFDTVSAGERVELGAWEQLRVAEDDPGRSGGECNNC